MLYFAKSIDMKKIYMLLIMALALSLLVLWNLHHMYKKLLIRDSIAKNFTMHPLSIWIEHERKTVLSAGYKHLQVSLLKSEIEN